MLYFGERKKGCRFIEVLFHGYRTLIIENDWIRTMLLVDKGLDILSLVHKRSDTDFVWTNPMGLSCMKKRMTALMDEDCYSDNYLGGFFEILPNFGDPCVCGNVRFPRHSEVSLLPWEMQLVEDSADCLKIRFTVKLSKYPFLLVKTLCMRNDCAQLDFYEELTNLSMEDMPYLWAQHPCIGKPFLDEHAMIRLPDEDIRIPAEGSGAQLFKLICANGCDSVAVVNEKSGLDIQFRFDPQIYTHCGVWIKANYDVGHHQFGGGYVASILPCNCAVLTLSEAVKAGVAPILRARQTVTSWYTIALSEI